jgi:hypothetical protein
MRTVRYKTHGAVGGESWQHSSLTEFLFNIPALSHSLRTLRIVPPLHVLNELLSSGISEAGMSGGCQWRSFRISDDEYAELTEDLCTLPGAGVSVDGELNECATLDEWHQRILVRLRQASTTSD